MGVWYQVALFPNVFQRQCVSDTTATYRQLPDGTVEVKNRCDVVFEKIRAIECGDDGISAHESAEYRVDGFVGLRNSTGITDTVTARTSYRHVFLADNLAFDLYFLNDGRYAVISEPTREYLWILSRQPRLSPADEAAIRSRLAQQGFSDLSRLQMHRHAP